ncbi:MAG: SelT/SelW/SelH family protein [Myxococcota bacterium]|nr:SelT/SelW/SelH family protein [Myxococcota bacterium]
MEPGRKSALRIEYCIRCNWRLRAAWYAQEILSTFENELSEVALVPSATAGHFSISIDDEQLFDRKSHGGFLEVKRVKRRVRDRVAPNRNLGHIDG